MSDFYDRVADGKYTAKYKEHTPDILKAFGEFDGLVFAKEGREIPLKYRELMACAVAYTTQCPFCIDAHANRAIAAGATEAELAEAGWVATALRAGAGFVQGRMGFKVVDHKH